MNLLRELKAIWSLEWRRLRSSPRVIILALLYILSCALLILVLGTAATAIQSQLKASVSNSEQADAAMIQLRTGVLGMLVDSSDPHELEALAHIPLIVFFGFRAALFFVPIWVALLGFDVVSEELSTRSLRYVTVRARRTSIVLGKFLALATALVALLLVLVAGLLFYARQLDPDFTGKIWLLTFVRCWAAASLFALGYLALTLLCSTLVATPALALALNAMALLAFWTVNAYGERARVLRTMSVEDAPGAAWEYLRFASPSHFGPTLLHPDPSRFLVGAAAFVGFIVVWVGGASLLLERRDV